jgi:hypothetical protein
MAGSEEMGNEGEKNKTSMIRVDSAASDGGNEKYNGRSQAALQKQAAEEGAALNVALPTPPEDPFEVFNQAPWKDHLSRFFRDNPGYEPRVRGNFKSRLEDGMKRYPQWKKEYEYQTANGVSENRARQNFQNLCDNYLKPERLLIDSLRYVFRGEGIAVSSCIHALFQHVPRDIEPEVREHLTGDFFYLLCHDSYLSAWYKGGLQYLVDNHVFREITRNRKALRAAVLLTKRFINPDPKASTQIIEDCKDNKKKMMDALITGDTPLAVVAAAAANEQKAKGDKQEVK